MCLAWASGSTASSSEASGGSFEEPQTGVGSCSGLQALGELTLSWGVDAQRPLDRRCLGFISYVPSGGYGLGAWGMGT
jgi:hypothetical protein